MERTRGEFDQPEGMRFVRKPFAIILGKSGVPVVGVTLDQRSRLCTLRANAEFIAEPPADIAETGRDPPENCVGRDGSHRESRELLTKKTRACVDCWLLRAPLSRQLLMK